MHASNRSVLTIPLAAADSKIDESGFGHGGRKAVCFHVAWTSKLLGDGKNVRVENSRTRSPMGCESESVVVVSMVRTLTCLTRSGTGTRGGRSVGPAPEEYGSPGSPPPTVSLGDVPRRWRSGSVPAAP